MSTITSFILSSLAGLSTIIGALIALNIKNKTNSIIIRALAFSSGVMLAISIFDLIPSAYNYIYQMPKLIIFIICGILLGFLSDKCFKKQESEEKKLYKVGLISMLAIIIHNIPEGIITFLTSKQNFKIGLSMSLAIAMHNIPEGISIAIPIYYGSKSKKRAYLYTIISGLSEVLGAVLAYLFLTKYMNNTFFGILFCLTAGIMIYISIFELLKTSLSYNEKKKTITSFIFGVLFSLIPIYFLQ